MSGDYHVFLSHSRNDPEATAEIARQLRRSGLDVFKDDENIQAGDAWLARLQSVLERCGAFVVLVGRDGVRRWVGAETQAALNRHFGPHDDAHRLPIFPILLDDATPEQLPPLLGLFQVTHWNPGDALKSDLLAAIRERNILRKVEPITGCPFVGLASYRRDQAHLFFGRRKETLDALACFRRQPTGPRVKWLEINGGSGSGKSSLMQAGLLPLVEQGWLWPRTGYERWTIIGPMMPGARPLEMLAECLGHAFGHKMAAVRRDLEDGDDALRYWLRDHRQHDTAFLLAIDQFEELFTFAHEDEQACRERERFDRLLALALDDVECPLFVVSTVRADFLDLVGELPELAGVRNRLAQKWTLIPIGADGLREVIQGPADLASLDVSEVKDWMVAEARNEPGALPLVETALQWLWQHRETNGAKSRLSGRLFTEPGGLAGIFTHAADTLLAGFDAAQRERALELLFRLVRVDRDGVRHARRSLALNEAVEVAGGDEVGRAVVHRLSGLRRPDDGPGEGPLRLITVADGSVSLIHETLIRSKDADAHGRTQPYWPTLWDYIEQHRARAAMRERLAEDVAAWVAKGRSEGLRWSHERVREAADALRPVAGELSPDERDFLGPIDPDAMLAELANPETEHRRRLLIGERLCVLGDPRPGVGVDGNGTPEIAWQAVNGGEVTITVEFDPPDVEWGEFRNWTNTVQPFRIARYPITLAQYRAFLNAEDGWSDPDWWGKDLYRDPEGKTYDVGRFGNHPAIYVSWFDAVAFCRWLEHRLGLEVRLPNEWEWQQAATAGRAENTFPWGAEWDPKQEPQLANTFESRLVSATAVSLYPDGASLTRALDMAGTVWEWCLNKHDEPDVEQSRPNDFESRVVRGGSWFYLRDLARAAYRDGDRPDYRNSGIGFRVVCSSPIFGH